MKKTKKIRWMSFLWLSIIVPTGFAVKFCGGPGNRWMSMYAAGALYEIFWILFFFFLFPSKRSLFIVPISVFASTSLLEFLQLWHPAALEELRATFLGGILLGRTFSVEDFPFYFCGCIIGWLVILRIWKEE